MATATDKAEPGWLQIALIGRNPRWTLARIGVLVLLALVVPRFVLLPIRVQGVSMLPNYRENSIRFVNGLAYWFAEPRRGDVVAIRFAGKHVMLLKRVVGLPGEEIAFHEGHVVINGKALEEPYVEYPCNWEIPPEKIGLNQFYVVGDNRSMFDQDHTKGRADRERIVGKVLK